jgi:YVTN family beta-propeller protein
MLPTALPRTDTAIRALIQERQQAIRLSGAECVVRHPAGPVAVPAPPRRPLPGMPALAGALLGGRLAAQDQSTRRRGPLPRYHWLAVPLFLTLLGSVVLLRRPSSDPLLRTIDLAGTAVAAAVDPRSGHLFVADATSDAVVMIDARTGAVLRTLAVGSLPLAVRVDARTSRAFVLDAGDRSLSVLDTQTGRLLRTIRLNRPVGLVVDERAGHLFVADADGEPLGTVYTLDARTGTLRRRTSLAGEAGSMALDSPSGRLFVLNSAQSSVSVLDAATGRLVRTVAVDAGPTAIAVDERTRHAFVFSLTGSVSMLDARSGAVLRTTPVGNDPVSLAIDGPAGRVFVVDDLDQTLSVLDARTGRRLRAVAIGGRWLSPLTSQPPVDSAVDEQAGHVFLLRAGGCAGPGQCEDPRVLVLDGTSGRFLRALSAGPCPFGLAVDRRWGHLLVLGARPPVAEDRLAWLPAWARPGLAWLPPPVPQVSGGMVLLYDLARL